MASSRSGGSGVDRGARRLASKVGDEVEPPPSLGLIVCPPRSCLREEASPEVGERGKETEGVNVASVSDFGLRK